MKEVWLNLQSWNKELVTESLESGIDAIMTTSDLVKKVKELGRITIIAPEGGDRRIPDDVDMIIIKDKRDELLAAESLKSRTVVVRTTDWNIIPIENLIPQGGEKLFTFVRNIEDARLAAGIMEKGVAGMVLETDDPHVIREVACFVKDFDRETVPMSVLTVTRVSSIGIGDRVCVDTCCNLNVSEGLLVGNSSKCLFLVHAENLENPYVAPRPFRVNAGAVHMYVRIPGNKTRYLGELGTGDPLMVVNSKGETSLSYVGRAKIEKRPLIVVFAKDRTGTEHSVVLQNAETIRLVNKDGHAVSVAGLKQGDEVLGMVEKGGRHFGMAVDETINEK